MTPFVITTLLSIAIIVSFLVISIRKFGWLTSYSAYNVEWDKAVPIHNAHLWSIVTFVVAFLFMPATIQAGAKNALQFLGFFVPLYLFIVAIFPITEEKPDMNEFERKDFKAKRIIHVTGAILCAIAIFLWVILVCRLWWVLIAALAAVAAAAYFTKTYKTSYIFWGEMVLFLTGYTAILISL